MSQSLSGIHKEAKKRGKKDSFVSNVSKTYGTRNNLKTSSKMNDMMNHDSMPSSNLMTNQTFLSPFPSEKLPSESFLVDEKEFKKTKLGSPKSDNTVSKIVNQSQTKQESWQIFAELRRQSREQNPEIRDDDWLDDEQWYCENKAD